MRIVQELADPLSPNKERTDRKILKHICQVMDPKGEELTAIYQWRRVDYDWPVPYKNHWGCQECIPGTYENKYGGICRLRYPPHSRYMRNYDTGIWLCSSLNNTYIKQGFIHKGWKGVGWDREMCKIWAQLIGHILGRSAVDTRRGGAIIRVVWKMLSSRSVWYH